MGGVIVFEGFEWTVSRCLWVGCVTVLELAVSRCLSGLCHGVFECRVSLCV